MARKRRPSKEAIQARSGMTRPDAKQYLQCWERVNALQLKERKAMTPTQRFRELVRLMEWGKIIGSRSALEEDERHARDVWNRLRRTYRGRI